MTPTAQMSQAQAIQADLQAKKTFATMAKAQTGSKLMLKQPVAVDPDLEAAAKKRAELELELGDDDSGDDLRVIQHI